MYLDKDLEFSSEQAITASAAATNYLDQGAARDLGLIEQKQICFTVTEAFDSDADDGTLDVKLQCDDNSSFSSAKDVSAHGQLAEATLVAGYQFYMPLPIGLDERYVRPYYTVGGSGNFTAGKITAAIVEAPQKNDIYPDAL